MGYLADLQAKLDAEEQRVADAVWKAFAEKDDPMNKLPDNYWHDLYRLRMQTRIAVAIYPDIVAALKEIAAD